MPVVLTLLSLATYQVTPALENSAFSSWPSAEIKLFPLSDTPIASRLRDLEKIFMLPNHSLTKQNQF